MYIADKGMFYLDIFNVSIYTTHIFKKFRNLKFGNPVTILMWLLVQFVMIINLANI